MNPLSKGLRRTLPFLWTFAIVFAPATDETRSGPHPEHQEPVDARVLAPTVPEAIVAVGSRETLRPGTQVRRSSSDPLPPTIATSLTLLAWILLAGPRELGRRAPIIAARQVIPRAPPGLQAA
ncbi:MAG: hypothetical protein ACRDH9_01555 [Actinomycetota bacterium]